MTVTKRTSPSADDTASGVLICMLRATRVILQPVCMEAVELSSFENVI
jgi:hypothetical protein